MDILWDHGECYIGGFILDRKLPTRFTPQKLGSNSEVQLCGKNGILIPHMTSDWLKRLGVTGMERQLFHQEFEQLASMENAKLKHKQQLWIEVGVGKRHAFVPGVPYSTGEFMFADHLPKGQLDGRCAWVRDGHSNGVRFSPAALSNASWRVGRVWAV